LYISKSELRSGVVDAPPSKAFTLRYLLASALSRGWVKLLGPNWGDDSWAMVRGVKPISEVEITTGSIRLRRSAVIEEYRVIDVGESGFTMRTLAAVYSGIRGLTLLVPRGSLRNRPMGELINALRGIGCGVEDIGGTLRIRGGRVGGGEVEISGSVSSQFISALLYLSPLTDGGIEVIVKPPIKSKPYIDSTVSVLREYGIRIEEMNNGLYIPGGQEFKPSSSEVRIPGDYGLSSYYIALAAVLGIDLEIRGLERSRAVEGEYDFVKLVSRMGVALEEEDDSLRVRGSSTVLNALDTDLSHAPDIVMPLALVMAKAPGRSRITGIEHLAYKESNRLLGTARILKCLGARVRVEEESGLLEVEGVEEWVGGCTVDAMGDHRLIMMGVIAGLSSRNPVEILDWEPVTKSWPTFLLELENMGALISYSQ
jgi:3-phosphoshikimate 1-carboxyvinyltransferase